MANNDNDQIHEVAIFDEGGGEETCFPLTMALPLFFFEGVEERLTADPRTRVEGIKKKSCNRFLPPFFLEG